MNDLNHILSSDKILFDLMKGGDSASFNILFDRHWERLYKTVYAVCADGETSSEIVHDIFLNLWLKREKLEIENFKGYMLAAARYHVYRHVKGNSRLSVEYREQLEASQTAVNDGEFNIRYKELEKDVNRELEVLPGRCKEIFTLSRREQLSNDEIASRLDISRRTVENQLTYALKHLRVSLKHFIIYIAILGI